MTRRKRTPPPAARPGSSSSSAATTANPSFRIPASLQQLSALSASLARSADKPAEEKASEIVRAAQAHAQAALSLGAALGEEGSKAGDDAGRSKETKAKKASRPLKWKTEQKLFPEQQTWVKPKAGGAVSGHATFMQRRYHEGQQASASASATGVAKPSNGEEQRALVQPRVEVNGGSAAPPVQGPDSTTASPVMARPLRVLMDGRVASFPPSNGTASTTTMGQALWGSGGGDDHSDGSNPRKKRRIEFVGRHQPDFPDSQIWVQAKPRGTVVRSYGGEIEARRQAIIAQLKQTHSPVAIIGTEGEADGHAGAGGIGSGSGSVAGGTLMTPSPTTASRAPWPASKPRPGTMTAHAHAHQYQHEASPAVGNEDMNHSAAAAAGAAGAQGVEFPQDKQAEIAALIAQKRAQNEASGQMQRLLGLRSEHQRKVLEQQQGINNGVFFSSPSGQPPFQHQQYQQQRMQGVGGPLLAPRPSMVAAMTDLPPFPPTMGEGGGEEDSDEDAPGEEDTPPTPSLPPGPAPAPAPASAVVASAVPPTLNTDPGDLRSLFSSPGPSTPQPDGIIPLGQRGGQIADAQAEEVGIGVEGPVSPSVQLLMALANAEAMPAPAPLPSSSEHRRTRSGLV